MGKTTYVALAYEVGERKVERKFAADHAQRIMDMRGHGGWQLVDPRFELDDNGTITRRSKKADKRAEAEE